MADTESVRATEVSAIKKIQADVGALLKPFQSLMRIKPGKAGDTEQLQLVLEQIPPKDTITAVVEEIRSRGAEIVQNVTAVRGTEFRKVEASFITEERQANRPIRELNSGWRIGALELEFERDRSKARLLFSKEAVIDWQPIRSVGDLKDLVTEGKKKLDSIEMSDASLTRVFWEAYSYLRAHKKTGPGKPARIPLRDFYLEVRVASVRDELRGGKRGDKKRAKTDLPLWGFLYNLSRYQQLRDAIPEDQRLGLETGSQQDHSKGLGMIVTALDSAQDSKTYCYVFDASKHEQA